jgi:leucine-rich repeat protein SHOC2
MPKQPKYSDCIPNPERIGFGLLSYRNHFKPMGAKAKLTASQKKQLKVVLAYNEDLEKEELEPMDCVDIVNTKTKGVLFQLYLYPEGSGKIFLNGTTTLFAEVLQHGYEFVIQPKTDKERVLAYRLLLDFASADEASKYDLAGHIGCSPADYLSDLRNGGFDPDKKPDFIEFEKARQKRGEPLRAKKSHRQVTLELEERNLKEIPAKVFKTAGLTRLNLGDNKISVIPPEIGTLENLQSLKLYSNEISVIPPEIGKLKKLKSLNLCGNKIESLPAEICELVELEELFLSGISLIDLPAETSRLQKLKNITFNRSKTIPKNIGQIPNLKRLDCRGCGWTDIPPEIFTITGLTLLNLNGNKLSKLPADISKLTNLEELQIGENQLVELPLELWNMKKLKDRYLYRNKLTVIPEEIGNLDSLEKLDIGDNKIKILPKAIGSMTNLKSMEHYWDNNPLENIPEKVKNGGINAIKKYLREN